MGRKRLNNEYPKNIEAKKGAIYFNFRYQKRPFLIHQKYCAEAIKHLKADDPDDVKQAGKWIAKTLDILKNHDGDFAKYFPSHRLAPEYGRIKERRIEEATLDSLIKLFLIHKKPNNQTQTAYAYNSAFNKLKDYFRESYRVKSFTKKDMDDFRSYLFDCVAIGTANSYLKSVRALFRYAYNYGYLTDCLAHCLPGVKIPNHQRQEKIDPFSLDEIDKITHACQQEWHQYFIQFAIYSGLRVGELYALAWEDIDLDRKTVTVCRSMEVKRIDGYPLFKLPKHDKIREIYINSAAVNALKKMRRLTQASQRIKVRVYPRSSNRTEDYQVDYIRPVFRRKDEKEHPSREGIEYEKLWLSHQSWRRIWTAILRRANVTYRAPRQTRHTFACWSLSSTVELTDLRDHMGHSSVTVLETYYAKWIDSAKSRQAEVTEKLLKQSGFIAEAL
ncbi:site-specific integrase [Endozoicomonas sp. Mp262]|uniref:tyrosine-type recombinase/integrase n=1 Tax=Endozoicomonas sp. Mp262 TaxID=2919499 RepID=UPI0021DA27C8